MRSTSINVDQAGGVTATLVAAISGYRVVVDSYNVAVVGAVATVKSTFRDLTANTIRLTVVGEATFPVMYTHSGGFNDPAFETAIDEGLELVTGTASAIVGMLTYHYQTT